MGRHRTLLVMSVITGFRRTGKSDSSRRGDGGHEQEEGKKLEGVGDSMQVVPLLQQYANASLRKSLRLNTI